LYNPTILRARIKYLCELKGITSKKLASDLGYGVNFLTQSTGRNGMSSSALYAIADYLDVSVDYLLGRTDKQDSHKN
jgi:transcriptional regulator with XRE-family HTH domain